MHAREVEVYEKSRAYGALIADKIRGTE